MGGSEGGNEGGKGEGKGGEEMDGKGVGTGVGKDGTTMGIAYHTFYEDTEEEKANKASKPVQPRRYDRVMTKLSAHWKATHMQVGREKRERTERKNRERQRTEKTEKQRKRIFTHPVML